MEWAVHPVGVVRADATEPVDRRWGDAVATIELDDAIPNEALTGLDQFSHVEVVFFADRASATPPWSRRPRDDPRWPEVGVFANRAKDRPNRILTSVVEVVAVGPRSVSVRGLDAIDGTPVLDLKPWHAWSGPRGAVRTPRWSAELGEEYF
ncbi:MAG TPA: SAM-dependent methyltransferase [Acidimicrobiales bacterium]|nr:SAM-dependent methyltransferase [Acidimicrobiales bacterium]